jgi:hypothetical protein
LDEFGDLQQEIAANSTFLTWSMFSNVPQTKLRAVLSETYGRLTAWPAARAFLVFQPRRREPLATRLNNSIPTA